MTRYILGDELEIASLKIRVACLEELLDEVVRSLTSGPKSIDDYPAVKEWMNRHEASRRQV